MFLILGFLLGVATTKAVQVVLGFLFELRVAAEFEKLREGKPDLDLNIVPSRIRRWIRRGKS